MNFDFSDDQKFLRDEARKFLESQCTMAQVREVLDDDSKSHNEGVWQKIVDMGWLGAAIPEEYGGLGLGMLELCVIAEELGRTLAPVPFGSSALIFCQALARARKSSRPPERNAPGVLGFRCCERKVRASARNSASSGVSLKSIFMTFLQTCRKFPFVLSLSKHECAPRSVLRQAQDERYSGSAIQSFFASSALTSFSFQTAGLPAWTASNLARR